MKKNLFYLFSLLILTTSCDRAFVMSGKIIDEINGKPINKAKIISSEKLVTYSDSLGVFKIDRFGPGSMSYKLEVLIEKGGYETRYFDLSKTKDLNNITLKIGASNKIQTTYCSKSLVKIFYLINLTLINLITIFTLFFIVFKPIKYKWIWIFVIIVVNITFKFNYINGLFNIDFFQLPFYLKHYGFYPFTVKIVLPISIIIFWAMYFLKKDLIIDKSEIQDKKITAANK